MCFVFIFTPLRFLTVFQTVISTRNWWRETLVCNPIQTHQPKKTICQFEEVCLKLTTLRVPHRKAYNITVMTSLTSEIMIKSTNQAHIRAQRVKICKKMCFVFSFTALRFLTVFQTVISTRSWWRGTLVCNPIQTHQPKKTICQFEENCLKITTVRVPHKKTYKITVMTSSKQNFEKLKKVSSQIFVKIIWVNFERIWSKIAEIINPYRQTHTRTDRAHPLG